MHREQVAGAGRRQGNGCRRVCRGGHWNCTSFAWGPLGRGSVVSHLLLLQAAGAAQAALGGAIDALTRAKQTTRYIYIHMHALISFSISISFVGLVRGTLHVVVACCCCLHCCRLYESCELPLHVALGLLLLLLPCLLFWQRHCQHFGILVDHAHKSCSRRRRRL